MPYDRNRSLLSKAPLFISKYDWYPQDRASSFYLTKYLLFNNVWHEFDRWPMNFTHPLYRALINFLSPTSSNSFKFDFRWIQLQEHLCFFTKSSAFISIHNTPDKCFFKCISCLNTFLFIGLNIFYFLESMIALSYYFLISAVL